MQSGAAAYLSVGHSLVFAFDSPRFAKFRFVRFPFARLNRGQFDETRRIAFLRDDQRPVAVAADDMDFGIGGNVGDAAKLRSWAPCVSWCSRR